MARMKLPSLWLIRELEINFVSAANGNRTYILRLLINSSRVAATYFERVRHSYFATRVIIALKESGFAVMACTVRSCFFLPKMSHISKI